MHKYDPLDPRHLDRVEAAFELVRMWRRLVKEGPGVPRYVILPGAALNQLVEWTDGFLAHPATPPPKG